MSLINFTVKYAQFGTEADGSDDGINADIVPLIGEVQFEPVKYDQRPYLAPNYDPPAGFTLRTITGFIDTDGVLRAHKGGPTGVRLIANDPVLNLAGIGYRVKFDLATPWGERVRVDGGFFSAPDEDRVIQLAEVLQQSLSVVGPRLVGGTFVDDTVIFENADGSLLSPIVIPNGVLVFVDNHDSTWSVG